MLVLQQIVKRFGRTVALDGVDLTVASGRIHGVLGENGAGKSTLMRIAAGALRPDAGTLHVDNQPLAAASALDARRAGIAMVHQHFMLVPTLTVAENCILGRTDQSPWVSRRALARELRDQSRRFGLDIDPDARVDTLSVGQQQRVEILRAVITAGRVLILDEPTAVLAPGEVDQLFETLTRLRGDGLAIAFISHKLAEVERICDEITILRHGRRVCHAPAASLTRAEMARHMIGRGVETDAAQPPRQPTSPAKEPAALLALEDLSARDANSRRRLHAINLTVGAGEIVGIAGVEGNGQDLLAAVIAGLARPSSGRVLLTSRDITHASPRRRHDLGLAHIPEDRWMQALVPAMSLAENLLLRDYRSPAFARAGFLRRVAIDAHAAASLARFDVRGGGPATPAATLSGGNQQKVVLARELHGAPRVILAHNPVRGLDIAATRFVFDRLRAARDSGAAILLIHSDLDELLAVADRVVVMFAGECIVADAMDREHTSRLMLGGAT